MNTRMIIAGGREFDNYELLEKEVTRIISELKTDTPTDIEIVSGVASGADSLGETYANQNGIKLKRFPAKWDDLTVTPCVIKYNGYGAYNTLAGHNRNEEMANYALENNGVLVAFWNGKSKGTRDMINRGKAKGLKIYIIKY